MIDWYAVLLNSSWILGVSILLAAFSYHYWLAPLAGRTLKEQLDQPDFQLLFWLSMFFICIGLVGTSRRAWETILWIIFLLISVVNFIMILRTKRKDSRPDGS